MKRTLTKIDFSLYPESLVEYFKNAEIYDSSCSPEAKVLFIDKDCGYYLKTANKEALRDEAEMTRYFHNKGLSSSVIEYISEERDYMLTERVVGEDCTHAAYIEDPNRLTDTVAQSLRMLHETDFADCPKKDRTGDYLRRAKENYKNKQYDTSYLVPKLSSLGLNQVWDYICHNSRFLKNEVLIHGDYCLPNVMLDGWRLSGFIDLGFAGVGDRHVDLFWGAWTLAFNLKTDKYRERFFDAYGREKLEPEIINLISAIEVFG